MRTKKEQHFVSAPLALANLVGPYFGQGATSTTAD